LRFVQVASAILSAGARGKTSTIHNLNPHALANTCRTIRPS